MFGQEANVNSPDQMGSNTISTRNIAMNVFETLMTRDENNHPILDLADAMTESPDHLTYTFTPCCRPPICRRRWRGGASRPSTTAT